MKVYMDQSKNLLALMLFVQHGGIYIVLDLAQVTLLNLLF